MGTDYYAQTIIGCEIKIPDVTTVICDRITPHGDALSDLYCGKCGARSHSEPRVNTHPGEVPENIGPFPVITWYCYKMDRYFVGVSNSRYNDGISSIDTEGLNLDIILTSLRVALTHLGMWDPTTFKIWSILVVSS